MFLKVPNISIEFYVVGKKVNRESGYGLWLLNLITAQKNLSNGSSEMSYGWKNVNKLSGAIIRGGNYPWG